MRTPGPRPEGQRLRRAVRPHGPLRTAGPRARGRPKASPQAPMRLRGALQLASAAPWETSTRLRGTTSAPGWSHWRRSNVHRLLVGSSASTTGCGMSWTEGLRPLQAPTDQAGARTGPGTDGTAGGGARSLPREVCSLRRRGALVFGTAPRSNSPPRLEPPAEPRLPGRACGRRDSPARPGSRNWGLAQNRSS